MFSKICKTAAVALCVMSGPALADWSDNLISLSANSAGDTGRVICAPNGTLGSVWGTGTYTSDSSICTAALHYGWITHGEGGVVSFRQVQGLETYPGSAQNGVTSSDYGAWNSSFQLVGAAAMPGGGGGATLIAWDDHPDALSVSESAGEVFTYACPSDPVGGGSVWGTDVYTSDSSICNAAVHRGHITAAQGGPVTILILGSQPVYAGSERNGVTSADYPAWSRSFAFQ